MHCMSAGASPPEHVAAEVRRRRQQRKWTLDVAAARLGVSRRLMAQIEAGGGEALPSTPLAKAGGVAQHLPGLIGAWEKPPDPGRDFTTARPLLLRGPHRGERL